MKPCMIRTESRAMAAVRQSRASSAADIGCVSMTASSSCRPPPADRTGHPIAEEGEGPRSSLQVLNKQSAISPPAVGAPLRHCDRLASCREAADELPDARQHLLLIPRESPVT